MSSASIPVVFQPRFFKDQYYMDGGTVWDTNVMSAITGCMGLGFPEEQIEVDILICSDPHLTKSSGQNSTMSSWMRARQIKSYYQDTNSIDSALRAYPNVNWRYLIK